MLQFSFLCSLVIWEGSFPKVASLCLALGGGSNGCPSPITVLRVKWEQEHGCWVQNARCCACPAQPLLTASATAAFSLPSRPSHTPGEIRTAAVNSATSSSESCSRQRLLPNSKTELTRSSQPLKNKRRHITLMHTDVGLKLV